MGETTGGVLRRGSDRILGGVCSGLAEYFRVDPLLVRVVFVILALTPPAVGIVLYFVLWFLMDPPAGTAAPAARNVTERLRAMGQEMKEDFRRNFSRSPAGNPATPPGTPEPPTPLNASGGPPNPPPPPPPHPGWWEGYRGRPPGLWAGIILIVLGAYFLLVNIGLLSGFRWDLFWPVVLIAIGLLVLVRRR
jgi:phage shock protein C